MEEVTLKIQIQVVKKVEIEYVIDEFNGDRDSV